MYIIYILYIHDIYTLYIHNIYIHNIYNETYSALRNEDIPSFVTTWMDLEGIMLSERHLTEKDKY